MPLITVIFQVVSVDEQSYEDKERHCKINDEEFHRKIIAMHFNGKEDVTTRASKWFLVVKERKGKVGISHF